MNSDLPKVLHPLGGVPLFAHALAMGSSLMPERTVLVTGHGAEAVEKAAIAIDPEIAIARQEERKGTGHAVLQARAALEGFDGDLMVLFADTPFIQQETIERMREARAGADVVVLGFEADPSTRYGRLIMDGDRLLRITEYKDATEGERAGTFMNSGLMVGPAKLMLEILAEVRNDNAAGEYYVTDVVELARAETLFQARRRAEAIETGVVLIAPETVHFALDTAIGRDAVIEPYVVFGPRVTIESGATIRSFSHIEGAHVGADAVVGPFARLRPGAELGDGAHVGNFVEIKNAELGDGVKVNHLTYIGDASIGKGTNIGAGTITCNYDGVFKHRTEIGRGAFIGSNTMLVAPVKVGDEAMTATGTIVTEDVPSGAMAIGRVRQVVKPGLAIRLMDKLRAAKAAMSKGSTDRG